MIKSRPRNLSGMTHYIRDCISFQHWLKDDNGKPVQLITYKKSDSGVWFAEAVLDDSFVWREPIDSVTYNSLAKMAGNGLLKFQSFLEKRIQSDQWLCYIVSNEAKEL